MSIIYKQSREINVFCEFALSNFAAVIYFVGLVAARLPSVNFCTFFVMLSPSQLSAFSASHHTVRKRRTSDS
jgi:hypothetical protein